MDPLYLFVASSTLLIYSAGACLHILTIVGIIVHAKDWRKNPGMLLIISLAVSDQMTCLPYIFGCIEAISNVQLFSFYSDYFIGYFNQVSWAGSTFHMLMMSINRFMAIVFPSRFHQWCGPKQTMLYIGISWMLSFGYCTVYAFVCSPLVWSRESVLVVYATSDGVANCDSDFALTAMAMIGPTGFYLLTVINLLLYGKHMRERGQTVSIDMRLCWQFAIILMFYIGLEACWYFVPTSAVQYGNYNLFYIICYGIAFDFTFNPLVYLVFNPTIRSCIRKLLSCQSNQVAVFNVHVRSSNTNA